jgi:hypothetical protein
MKTIEIQILARDVNNSGSFFNTNDCILATAIKRQLNVTDVIEGVNHSFINSAMHHHDEYNIDEYEEDRVLARGVPDDTLIRTIILNNERDDIFD